MKSDMLCEYMKNHTKNEAAAHFRVSTSTIERRLRALGLKYYDLKYGDFPKQLNDIQMDLFVGTMLGDATINSKCGYYSFSQAMVRKGYVLHVAEIMKPFVISCKEVRRDAPLHQMRTITSPVFKNLRSLWYYEKQKIVPSDLKLNPRRVAYWYCDDGYLLARRKRLELATNGFKDEEVLFLIELLGGMGIKASLHRDNGGKPIIRVKQRSFWDFIEMVKPHIPCECMYYKFNTSDTAIKEGWGANKLDAIKARIIRREYFGGSVTQSQLAEKFGVSRKTINNVINEKVYPGADLGLRGSADVKLILH